MLFTEFVKKIKRYRIFFNVFILISSILFFLDDSSLKREKSRQNTHTGAEKIKSLRSLAISLFFKTIWRTRLPEAVAVWLIARLKCFVYCFNNARDVWTLCDLLCEEFDDETSFFSCLKSFDLNLKVYNKKLTKSLVIWFTPLVNE